MRKRHIIPVGYFDDPYKKVKIENPEVTRVPAEKAKVKTNSKPAVKTTANRRGRNRERTF